MWYDAPAKEREEALPVGNVCLGAMVFGGYGEERILLNEEHTGQKDLTQKLWREGRYHRDADPVTRRSDRPVAGTAG